MIVRLTIISFLMLSFAIKESKGQFYNQWPMGYDTFVEHGWGLSILDFNDERVSIPPPIPTNYWIGGNSSFICNSEGQLELISNGCIIADSKAQIIPNGDSLFSGLTFDLRCPNATSNVQNTLFVPDLTDAKYSILLVKDTDVNTSQTSLTSYNLYYNLIYSDQGVHEVLEKRFPLRSEEAAALNFIATPHANQEDWWVIESGQTGTNEFRCYRVSKDTAYYVTSHFTGPTIEYRVFNGSQMAISPDGKNIAWQGQDLPINHYSFDDETGVISYLSSTEFEQTMKNDTNTLGTLCYSPNSKYLYHSDGYYINQVNNDTKEVIQVAHIGRSSDPRNNFPVFAVWMYIGPDCKIYISPGSTTSFLHTINRPNLRGVDCEVKFNSVVLPTLVYRRLPNKAFYHKGVEGSILCDSTIRPLTSVIDYYLDDVSNLVSIIPNPIRKDVPLTLISKFPLTGILEINDISGKRLYISNLKNSNLERIDAHLPRGVHLLRVINAEGNQIVVKKLIIN